jgi:hypothetical protein
VHLVDEQVQRLLHGELTGPAAQEVQAHLATCSECRVRVQEAEREDHWVIGHLAALDHPLPPISSGDIVRAAGFSRSRHWGRWAAGIFLAAALAGGAYAAPGSPLPGLLARLLASDSSVNSVVEPRRSERSAAAGVAVAAGERLTISLPNGTTRDSATISLSDGTEVMIQARGGQTSFRSDPERLIVDHSGDPGQFEIRIPTSARLVEVEVRGRRIFRKEGSDVTARVPPDSLGRYVVPLASTR